MEFEYHLFHDKPTESSLAYTYVGKHTSSVGTVQKLQAEVRNKHSKSFPRVKSWSRVEIQVYKVVHSQDLSEYF